MTANSRTLLLCDHCKGSGFTEHEEMINYHTRENRYYTRDCAFCDGTGRRYKVVTVTFEPYKPNKPAK